MRKRSILALFVGWALAPSSTAQATFTYYQFQKCLQGCCTLPAYSVQKNVCISNCWARYLSGGTLRDGTGGSSGTLDSTSVSISPTSEGYRSVSGPGSPVIYNNMVYQANQEVTVIVNVNAAAHAHCTAPATPVACCTGNGMGNCVTSMRMSLVEPANNPQPGLCVSGANNGNPCGFDYVGCPGGTCIGGVCRNGANDRMPCGVDQCPGGSCTGIRRTCQGGGTPGAACTMDANCSGGTCERTLGTQVDVCSNNGNGTWTCAWTPTTEHAGDLVVESEIVGHDLDANSDSAFVVAATRSWGVPTLSSWGMAVMILLVLAAGTIVLRHGRARALFA